MKAFLFDVDDTLYDQVQPFARTFYRLYPERNDIDIHKLFARSRVYSDEVLKIPVREKSPWKKCIFTGYRKHWQILT